MVIQFIYEKQYLTVKLKKIIIAKSSTDLNVLYNNNKLKENDRGY